MPYRWTHPDISPAGTHVPPQPVALELWPYRSLPRQGFVWVIGLTAGALALPMIALVGTGVLWGLLPFVLLIIWLLWTAIERSYRTGTTHETLLLSWDALVLTRQDPGREDRIWRTNPYWVRIKLREDGPVEDYLTLTDGQREIELGRFLSPEERQSLRKELGQELARLHEDPARHR